MFGDGVGELRVEGRCDTAGEKIMMFPRDRTSVIMSRLRLWGLRERERESDQDSTSVKVEEG